jgi:microcystin-dependent protein
MAAGGSQPHENMMPFTTINFIIATEGIYPQSA